MPNPSDASPPARAYEVVLSFVEDGILGGELHVGDVLPSERDLAQQLGVSRSAVREGVRALSAMGVVHSRVGAGSAGGTVITAVASEALNRFLRMHVALAQFSWSDVVEVRSALEALSGRLAAKNASKAQLDGLVEILDSMDSDALSVETFNELDTNFHVELARTAGNSLATDLTVAIRESMKRGIHQGLEAKSDWTALRDRLRSEHRAIHQAVVNGDGAQAAKLLEEHIRHASAEILDA